MAENPADFEIGNNAPSAQVCPVMAKSHAQIRRRFAGLDQSYRLLESRRRPHFTKTPSPMGRTNKVAQPSSGKELKKNVASESVLHEQSGERYQESERDRSGKYNMDKHENGWLSRNRKLAQNFLFGGKFAITIYDVSSQQIYSSSI